MSEFSSKTVKPSFKCGSLLDESKKELFEEELLEEYDEIREEHYESLKVLWCDVAWCGVMWCGVLWCGVM